MPCTYPMIPITVSYFTKQAEARHGRVLPLSLTYGAGIVLIFILVGALVGQPIIKFAQNGWVNLALCAAFIYFALALFGIYELKPPRFLMNATSGASTKGGYVGVFLMGVALVVATFACTFPVLGMLLALTATKEGAHYGLVTLGMGVFGLTMAVPFVVLSLIPGKLQAMPRSGEWMNMIKVVFAFIEIAMALKFFSNADMVWGWKILPREPFLFIWFGIFLVAGLYLVRQSLKGGLGKVARGRLAWGLATLALAVYLLYGAVGKPLHPFMSNFEPNYSKHEIPRHTVIEEDYDKAISVAKVKKKRVLVNFTGVT
jgi:thiol:disulfide interchange protein DsbD